MSNARTDAPARRKSLRLWPGVVAVTVQWLAWFGLALVFPEATPWGIVVALYAGLAVILWWLLFSSARWLERVGVLALMIVAIVATKRVVHASMAGGGMGFLLYIYAIPVLSLALVLAAAAGRRLSDGPRRATMVGAILLACGAFTLVRTGGVTGEGDSDIHWRWSATPEERLLAEPGDAPAALSTPAESSAGADWPGFRGPQRDGIVRGVRIETDWSKSPPVELWRRPIGPGWSSFAVRNGLVYTQEQRGEDELVSCYRLSTGEPVWRHADPVRFYESNGGAGPRGTPTLHDGRVYALGATGVVNALDAGSGELVWSRDAAADTDTKVPDWGFAGSPLVINKLVIVAASGRLVAYDIVHGKQRWLGAAGGMSYSSPHLATIDGVPQVLLLSGGHAAGFAPADGASLWTHEWEPGASIVQPGLTADGDVLLSSCYEMGGIGLRRIALTQSTEDKGWQLGDPHMHDEWSIEERWTSRGIKPYFNDFVVHEGHAFGFDNSILACIDLADGARKWKGGRYGYGQLLLLADADVLIVLSEEGELALVEATSEQFTELARFPALEGKTWNHPVLAGDVLLVRNAEEMAAFRLSATDR